MPNVTTNLYIIVHEAPVEFQGSGIKLLLEDAKKAHHDGTGGHDGSLQFDCTVTIRPRKDGTEPDFFGPFVSGPVGERFIYLTWKWDSPNQFGTFRRIKVPLEGITWDLIEKASHGVLTARIAGTGKDGSPACATVPLLGDGWTA